MVRGEAVGRVQARGPEEALAEAGDGVPGGRLIGSEGGRGARVVDGRRARGRPLPAGPEPAGGFARGLPAPPDPGRPVGVMIGAPSR